jgi:S-formylglutathione hydrolase FrmB
MGAIFSFLGGGAFRAIWGELSSYFTKRQDAKLEIERMRLQGDLDAAQATRNLEAIKVQAALGVKTIQVQADADVARSAADAFEKAVERAATPTGIRWVDAWNGIVRPSFATVVISLWVLALYRQNWVLAAWDLDMMGSIAGFYFADRSLGKRNK